LWEQVAQSLPPLPLGEGDRRTGEGWPDEGQAENGILIFHIFTSPCPSSKIKFVFLKRSQFGEGTFCLVLGIGGVNKILLCTGEVSNF
jgi:hypothetical protein